MTQASGYFQYYNATERLTKILGIDIAGPGGQYPMNYATAYSAGARFCYMRASRATTTKDTGWNATEISNARLAGIKVGAYHYSNPSVTGYTTTNAEAEADWFIAKMAEEFPTGDYGDLMPMLDFEDPSAIWASNDVAYDWVEAFCNRVKTVTGRQCILYTAYYYVDPLTATPFAELVHSTKGGIYQVAPLWLAGNAPDLPENQPPSVYPNYNFTGFGDYPNNPLYLWTLWQFSSDGNSRGSEFGASSTDIDIDILETDLFSIMPPSKPVNLSAIAGDSVALLSWNPISDSDVVSYKIYKDDVLEDTVPSSQSSYLVTGLTNATPYKFEVSAVDSWEEGELSEPAYATPTSATITALAGKNAKILAYGSSIVFTDEATTSTDNRTYQITDTTKRIWCKDCTIVIKDGGSPTTENYTLDRLTGRVIFETTGTRTITISGYYLPTHTIGCAYEYTWTLSADNADATCFEHQFMGREQTLKDFSASISKFYDTTNYFFNKLFSDDEFVIEFYVDGSSSPDLRAWGKIATDEDSASVDGLVEESIDIEGTLDADRRAISFGPF